MILFDEFNFQTTIKLKIAKTMNLKIVLRASEIKPYMNFIDHLFNLKRKSLSVADFYNLRMFVKKLFDRQYKLFGSEKKQITIQVDINLLQTLILLSSLTNEEMEKSEFNLCKVLYYDVVMQLNRQMINIPNENLLPIA